MRVIQFEKLELLLSLIPKLFAKKCTEHLLARLACRQTLQNLEIVAKFHEREVAICQPILEFA